MAGADTSSMRDQHVGLIDIPLIAFGLVWLVATVPMMVWIWLKERVKE